MKKYVLILFVSLFCKPLISQDLNCKITLNTDAIQLTNKQIFTSLEQAITQFMNNRKWSQDRVLVQERIDVNMVFRITSMPTANSFTATIQLQSTRPVFGSEYTTVLFNHLDNEIAFEYDGFQALEYVEESHLSNLTSTLAFYANIIVGLDYDSYSPNGGTAYFLKAQRIAQVAQSDYGWSPSSGSGNKNRYYLVNNLLDDRFAPMRELFYSYHRLGLDVMHDNPEKARQTITKGIESLQDLSKRVPNAMLFKVFFNAKNLELIEIYKGGTPVEKARIVELLSKMDPANQNKYIKIKG